MALYRRYRPEIFEEVIGQEHVIDPLMAALEAGRTNHAYLFSGPRGCGKTTSARILARALNCVEYPTATPCGECDSCRELARGGSGSLDVLELDAASHGGVDDARDLREQVAFAPVRDRFKIFIIDEAHMVTEKGFNALLKVVEEPPEHVKFIFATTEPEKVIGTIRSRTHHYPFRLVPPDTLEAYLREVCEKEGIDAGHDVLQLIVRAGTGSVRDTLSVLDQIIGGSDGVTLDYARTVALLGFTSARLIDASIDALIKRDGAALFSVVDDVVKSGHDPRRFVEDLLQRLRDLVIIALAGEGARGVFVSVPEDQYATMLQEAQQLGARRASQSADLTNTALNSMVGATAPRMQLELLCARLIVANDQLSAAKYNASGGSAGSLALYSGDSYDAENGARGTLDQPGVVSANTDGDAQGAHSRDAVKRGNSVRTSGMPESVRNRIAQVASSQQQSDSTQSVADKRAVGDRDGSYEKQSQEPEQPLRQSRQRDLHDPRTRPMPEFGEAFHHSGYALQGSRTSNVTTDGVPTRNAPHPSGTTQTDTAGALHHDGEPPEALSSHKMGSETPSDSKAQHHSAAPGHAATPSDSTTPSRSASMHASAAHAVQLTVNDVRQQWANIVEAATNGSKVAGNLLSNAHGPVSLEAGRLMVGFPNAGMAKSLHNNRRAHAAAAQAVHEVLGISVEIVGVEGSTTRDAGPKVDVLPSEGERTPRVSSTQGDGRQANGVKEARSTAVQRSVDKSGSPSVHGKGAELGGLGQGAVEIGSEADQEHLAAEPEFADEKLNSSDAMPESFAADSVPSVPAVEASAYEHESLAIISGSAIAEQEFPAHIAESASINACSFSTEADILTPESDSLTEESRSVAQEAGLPHQPPKENKRSSNQLESPMLERAPVINEDDDLPDYPNNEPSQSAHFGAEDPAGVLGCLLDNSAIFIGEDHTGETTSCEESGPREEFAGNSFEDQRVEHSPVSDAVHTASNQPFYAQDLPDLPPLGSPKPGYIPVRQEMNPYTSDVSTTQHTSETSPPSHVKLQESISPTIAGIEEFPMPSMNGYPDALPDTISSVFSGEIPVESPYSVHSTQSSRSTHAWDSSSVPTYNFMPTEENVPTHYGEPEIVSEDITSETARENDEYGDYSSDDPIVDESEVVGLGVVLKHFDGIILSETPNNHNA